MSRSLVRSSFSLRSNCSHGCTYCDCPSLIGITPQQYYTPGPACPGALDELLKDAIEADGSPMWANARAFFSMIADPYCPEEAADQTTRKALQIMLDHHVPVTILSKGGTRAMRDLDLFLAGDTWFGQSLVWLDDAKRALWEPNAAPVADRLEALRQAKAAGLYTWMSIAPALEPEEALAVLDLAFEIVDEIWVEGLRSLELPEITGAISWQDFSKVATDRLETWKSAAPDIRSYRMKRPFNVLSQGLPIPQRVVVPNG
ncbi:MAG: radical SAM family protein [Armatimonadota bacterium]